MQINHTVFTQGLDETIVYLNTIAPCAPKPPSKIASLLARASTFSPLLLRRGALLPRSEEKPVPVEPDLSLVNFHLTPLRTYQIPESEPDVDGQPDIQEKVNCAIASIFQALAVLKKRPSPPQELRQCILAMQETIESFYQNNPSVSLPIDDFEILELPDNFEASESLEVKRTKAEEAKQIFLYLANILGDIDNETKAEISLFLQKDGILDFMKDYLARFFNYRALNSSNFLLGKFENLQKQEALLTDPMDVIAKTTEEDPPLAIVGLFKNLAMLAVPCNMQIHTDGFSVGLFDPELVKLDAGSTLAIAPHGPLERRLASSKDENGYEYRFNLRQRDRWINVQPTNILEGNRPFQSGTRQISFKLPNGARREAKIDLDLTPLREMSFAQNLKVLEFILQVGDTYRDENLLEVLKKNEEKPLLPSQLGKPALEKTLVDLQALGFSEENIRRLITLALNFNKELTIRVYLALFTLTPDIHSSCIDHLQHLYKEGWKAKKNLFDAFWGNNGEKAINITHQFLELYEKVEYARKGRYFQVSPMPSEEAVIEQKIQLVKIAKEADDLAGDAVKDLLFSNLVVALLGG